MADDDGPIHWPNGLTPAEADVFRQDETGIRVSRRTVWRQLIMAPHWTSWWPDVGAVRIRTGPAPSLEPESTLELRSAGRTLQVSVAEFVDERRLAFFGYADDLTCYWAWLLADEAAGCRIRGELTACGRGVQPPAAPLVPGGNGRVRPLSLLRMLIEENAPPRHEEQPGS